MSQKIQVRRGTDAARQTVVFDVAEPVFTVDTSQFYIGDGLTTGGISAGGLPSSAQNFTIVSTTTSETTNGLNLITAVNSVPSKTPYGKPLSSGNRYTIFIPPGKYDLGSSGLLLDYPFVNLCGIGNEPECAEIISLGMGGGNLSTIAIRSSGSVTISNLTITAINTASTNYPISIVLTPTFDIKLDNLNLNVSGDSTPISALDSPGVKTCNSIFNRLKTNRGIFASSNGKGLSGVLISDCYIVGDKSFQNASNSSAPGGNSNFNVINSTFIGNSGFLFAANILYDRTASMSNCYISGVDWFGGITNNVRGYRGTINDCSILGGIKNFDGRMFDTIIDATNQTGYAIYMDAPQATAIIPLFSNCYILGNTTLGVCGSGNSFASGMFNHCKFNIPLWSGLTGALPTECQYNITSPRFI